MEDCQGRSVSCLKIGQGKVPIGGKLSMNKCQLVKHCWDEEPCWLHIDKEEEPASGILSGKKGHFRIFSEKRCQFVTQCHGRSAG